MAIVDCEELGWSTNCRRICFITDREYTGLFIHRSQFDLKCRDTNIMIKIYHRLKMSLLKFELIPNYITSHNTPEVHNELQSDLLQ